MVLFFKSLSIDYKMSLNEVKEVLAELNLKLNMNREDLLNKVQVELGVNRNNYV